MLIANSTLEPRYKNNTFNRRFSKRKHILRQLTCWCAIFSGNIPASCDRANRSARRLRNGRGYKPCL